MPGKRAVPIASSPDAQPRFENEEDAYEYVGRLRKYGYWPGVRLISLTLTSHPPVSLAEVDSHGYVRG